MGLASLRPVGDARAVSQELRLPAVTIRRVASGLGLVLVAAVLVLGVLYFGGGQVNQTLGLCSNLSPADFAAICAPEPGHVHGGPSP